MGMNTAPGYPDSLDATKSNPTTEHTTRGKREHGRGGAVAIRHVNQLAESRGPTMSGMPADAHFPLPNKLSTTVTLMLVQCLCVLLSSSREGGYAASSTSKAARNRLACDLGVQAHSAHDGTVSGKRTWLPVRLPASAPWLNSLHLVRLLLTSNHYHLEQNSLA